MRIDSQIKEAIWRALLACGVLGLGTYGLHRTATYLSATWGIEIGSLSFGISFSLIAALALWAAGISKFLERVRRRTENPNGQS
jgi:hypothetical protein